MPLPLAGALVALASAAVLVLEILVVRLAAPYVGLTLETYTAAISVALAGIAVGSWLGGRVADAVDPRRYLPLLFLAGGGFVFAARPLVLALGPGVRGGGAVGVVVLVLVAVTAPVVLLSAVPPGVVKLSLARLETAGSVVGQLSAISTAGALAGSFLTGFVLLGALSVGRILLVTGVLLVAVGLALAVRARRLAARGPLAAVAAAGLLGALTTAYAGPCQVDTRYYCARVTSYADDPGARSLYLDDLHHAFVDLDDPRRLSFAYTQRFADAIRAAAPADRPLDALHLGGGGFTMPRWLAAERPGSRSTVLELDPDVVAIGRAELGLRTSDALRVSVTDGRTGIVGEPDAAYDVVVGDAFGSLSVPWHLATREFTAQVRRVLRPGGVYVLNVIDWRPLSFVRAETATVAAVFPEVAVVARPGQLQGIDGGNFVLVAAVEPLPVQELRRLAGLRSEGVTDGAGFARGAAVLTDDRAPVDQLLSRPSVTR